MKTFVLYTVSTKFTVRNCTDEQDAFNKLKASFERFSPDDVWKVEELHES